MKPYQKKTGNGPNVVKAAEVEEMVNAVIGTNMVDGLRLRMADTRYCLPSLAAAETIIQQSDMKQLASSGGGGPREESFDCDDFALLLKARFAYAAYRDPSNFGNCPYCFGIVWGMLPFPFPHSMNWMITDDRRFYFVEPQREQILTLEDCRHFRYINFLMV